MPVRWSCARLHPLGSPGGGIEWIGEVLGFVRDLVVPKFHDADGVRARCSVIDHVLGDPEAAFSRDATNREPGGSARMVASKSLQVAPASNDFTRLWVFAHHVIVIDGVLGNLVTCCGSSPVLIDG